MQENLLSAGSEQDKRIQLIQKSMNGESLTPIELLGELKGRANDDNYFQYSVFRGKEIKVIQVDKKAKRKPFRYTENEQEIEKGVSRILYDGMSYTLETFLQEMFPRYKEYRLLAKFKNDNIFYMNGTQRAKLQYNILECHINSIGQKLLTVDEQERKELKHFFGAYSIENGFRINWENGLEKMISFGASIKVNDKDKEGNRKNNKGIFCYKQELEENRITCTGVKMDWQEWANKKIMDYKTYIHTSRKYDVIEHCLKALPLFFSHNDIYLTLPKKEYDVIHSWIFKYIQNYVKSKGKEETPFPFQGTIGNDIEQFTIDFEKDVDIIPNTNLNIGDNMAIHNKEHAKSKGEKSGKKRVKNRWEDVKGDSWTTKELYDLGYNSRTIKSLVNKGLIRRVRKGYYERVK